MGHGATPHKCASSRRRPADCLEGVKSPLAGDFCSFILRAFGAHDMPSARYTVCQKQTIRYIASRCDMFRFAERKGKNPPRRIFIIAWRLSKSVLFVDIEIHLLFKTKSAPTEVDAPKNANPDCRQTNFKQSEGHFVVHN